MARTVKWNYRLGNNGLIMLESYIVILGIFNAKNLNWGQTTAFMSKHKISIEYKTQEIIIINFYLNYTGFFYIIAQK